MNMTMNEARVARRLRGIVNSSTNLLRPRVISFSASKRTWISMKNELCGMVSERFYSQYKSLAA